CHWCHVMERESFEDNEVAEVLNESFISIKVDREERPDIDTIYMNVCQTLTGSGGWPLTIIMTPDQKPFFAGTYYPKNDKMGLQGLLSILEAVKKGWSNNREVLLNSGETIMEYVSQEQKQGYVGLSDKTLHEAFNLYSRYFDPVFGGFGHAPKFPTPHNLMFLLRYWKKTGEPKALEIVEKTLDSMYRGGIYDHIGFGFCRYSTDRRWLVPHFEKMLYDNALLAITYSEAYLATKKEEYAHIARDILDYILRDMTSSEGGFYSAEDADSEGVEGKFYLWDYDEVEAVLGQEEGRAFSSFYNITHKGNFEGRNIPNLINNHLPYEHIDRFNSSRMKLFNHREGRIHPFKDDKILTSWNGLMISAMALAGRTLQDNRYTNTAINSVRFIFENLLRDDGRLLARYREGEAGIIAYLEDYAFLIQGLIDLYETTYDSQYLKKALDLSEDVIQLFWDDENGGFYLYGSDGEQLITRPKEIYDGAIPSGNSVMALNFIRLGRITGKFEFEERADKILQCFSSSIASHPIAYAYSLMALLYGSSESQEIVILSKKEEEAKPFIDIINSDFRPFTVSLLYMTGDEELLENAPFIESYIKSYQASDENTLAYICEKGACKAPVSNYNDYKALIK
ncbi:MAG: thioredoxin domain-containing protein, partial [Acetivibrionales bacterium]